MQCGILGEKKKKVLKNLKNILKREIMIFLNYREKLDSVKFSIIKLTWAVYQSPLPKVMGSFYIFILALKKGSKFSGYIL